MAKNLLLDSGFWFALYDSRDRYHDEAQILADLLDFHNLVIPMINSLNPLCCE
ncbi:hypothetical protein Desac_1347 [Desulfobacca acetoxidans DSM 11109]|uniref:Uncharacterized protein n=1 Tax=Desulfobacca acetoxidans (strain ATCC 700848 / DSM 11109 / ASRB2) TaxID=880072 RepID=F2NHL7_DESAR|nr:hypothetical protein Desac_1347 [Desulfobacca acetoxidans DSM 11109]